MYDSIVLINLWKSVGDFKFADHSSMADTLVCVLVCAVAAGSKHVLHYIVAALDCLSGGHNIISFRYAHK